MRLFTTVAGLRCYLSLQRASNSVDIGLVPTMGSLHQGHLSLIQRARRENALVVVSIFVNPLQFGPTEDFHAYPRTLESDRQLCEQAGVDVIFAPTAAELGITVANDAAHEHSAITQVIPPSHLTQGLCGQTRPGHFQGVATIVTKLLNIVQPDRAYFGQKDAQQLVVIQQLVADLNLPVEIVACPIVREASGLAFSSRNQYLSGPERDQATVIYRSLKQAMQMFRQGERRASSLIAVVHHTLATEPAIVPEYVALVDPATLAPLDMVTNTGLLAIAARLGTTRLIDNVLLKARRPIIAIDGPAGAGKSTVTQLVAEKLGLLHLNTGAMYRAVTWLVRQAGIAWDDEAAIAELVSNCQIQVSGVIFQIASAQVSITEPIIEQPQSQLIDDDSLSTTLSRSQVKVNGQDVTDAIRSPEVTAMVSAISAQPAVRRILVQAQRLFGRNGNIVAEGRDVGSVVFPDAEVKIFLTASAEERARRRQREFRQQGKPEVSLPELVATIAARDDYDSTRRVSPLRKAVDAVEIHTDNVTIDKVVQQIIQLYKAALSKADVPTA
ncbi:MAG: bifunctional pantoate--beta-alanine ligase/(d)CMP kinase [Cyanobacteria bacterium]|nr:bifunctional pantoate--beta-alanine ligase/(d)CMP kinase [Cyanobacteriota bacterium]MDW8202510.1 bifunctional pantoate--beta-alanine ligase/(d)CMP kinase [Cyanobacteriota bacterium SKYGB_h_bin112]